MKQPWLKFYPSDWRADPALRMCSLAARGLWIEMLCLMHEARPFGFLLVNGRPVTAARLANLVGAGVAEVEGFLVELEEAGVFSRDADGALYSRRMRRDEERAAANRVNGRAGGNPSLKAGVNPGVNPPVKAGVKAQKPESRNPDARSRKQRRAGRVIARGARQSRGLARLLDCFAFGSQRRGLQGEARRDRGRLPRGAGRGRAGRCRDRADARRRRAIWRGAGASGARQRSPAQAATADQKLAAVGGNRRRVAGGGAPSPPPVPGETAELLNGETVPRAALMAAVERWNAGGDWPTSLGGPPRRHGCALPEEFLAMCVETS